MKDNNITNLNEYKNQNLQGDMIEEFSDEMVQAYIDAAGIDTPDLWSRIDAGFEAECSTIRLERNHKKKLRRKTFGAVAAVLVLTVLAIPVMALFGNSKEETKSSKNDIAYDMEDSVITEAPAHNQSAKDEAEIMEDVSAEEPALDDAPAEEATEATDNSVTGSDGENGDIPNATDQVTITDERIIRVYGYFIAYDDKITIRITSVASNEYEEFDVGVDTEITLSNPWMLETLSIDWTYFEAEAYFDSLSIDDNGEYVARLSDFNWIEKTSK